MNKWTIEKLKTKVENWQRKTPAPFPGKYPTRIAWEVKLQRLKGISDEVEKTTFRYVGKPNAMELNRLQRVLIEVPRKGWSPTSVFACEFDTKGLISKTVEDSGLYRFGTRNWTAHAVALALRTYYHPWDMASSHLTEFQGKFWLKRIKGKTRVHTVYSPVEKMTEKAVTDYKEALALGAERKELK